MTPEEVKKAADDIWNVREKIGRFCYMTIGNNYIRVCYFTGVYSENHKTFNTEAEVRRFLDGLE